MFTKDWLQEKIAEHIRLKEAAQMDRNNDEFYKQLGMVLALREIQTEFTKPPEKKEPKPKVDHDETYRKIVKYYIDKKGYTPEQAANVAINVIKGQQVLD